MDKLKCIPKVHIINGADNDIPGCWYRAKIDVQTRSSSVNEWGDYTFYDMLDPLVHIYFTEYRVIRETSCGVWLLIDDYNSSRIVNGSPAKFVLRNAVKRFACPTRKEALESLTARYSKRKRILERELKETNIALDILKELK